MAYAESLPTGDPNKDDEQVDMEAALAYLKLKRGHRADDICKEMGLSRRTFYRRVEALILAQDRPGRRLMQALEADRLDDLTLKANELLEGEVSNADASRLIGEARQLSAARRKMLGLDQPVRIEYDHLTEAPPSPVVAEWAAKARAQADEDERGIREGLDDG